MMWREVFSVFGCFLSLLWVVASCETKIVRDCAPRCHQSLPGRNLVSKLLRVPIFLLYFTPLAISLDAKVFFLEK
jgi:hypothetical protein